MIAEIGRVDETRINKGRKPLRDRRETATEKTKKTCEEPTMAKASIKCTCPECGTIHYYTATCHNRREADSWEEYHAGEADTRLCPECYRKHMSAKRAEERAAENEVAAQRAAELSLPALSGSEKQIAWANTIRQKALDEALTMSAGRASAGLNDDGRALVGAVMARMSAEARWWIDHREDAAHLVREELECSNWARIDDDARATHLDKLRADVERNAPGIMGAAAKATLAAHERYERARLAGRTSMEQRDADEAAAEAAKRAALPPVPLKLAERLGYPRDARWNGKWYGRDGLRVYLDGQEVQVSADVKAAWTSEWDAYNAARKAAGL